MLFEGPNGVEGLLLTNGIRLETSTDGREKRRIQVGLQSQPLWKVEFTVLAAHLGQVYFLFCSFSCLACLAYQQLLYLLVPRERASCVVQTKQTSRHRIHHFLGAGRK